MALYDIVLPTDHVTVSDVVARQLNAGVVAKVFDIQISDEISVVDSLPRDVIISDTIEVTDSIQAIIIDTLAIANARALSATKVRIDFSAPAADPTNGGNPALTNVASYVFTPISPGAVGVVPQSVDLPPGQTEPQYVEINITEHTDGAIYQVSLSSAIQGANSEVGGGPAFSYAGKGASPVVERVFATSPTEVIVFFDEQILDNPAANDVANYVWDHGIATVAVKSVIGNLVTLETTEQNEGELYLLTVRGIFQVVINDVIQVTDQQPIPNLHTVWAFDEVGVTDQLQAETDYVRQISDAIDVSDQVQVDFTQDRIVNDAVAVTDQLQVEVTYDRTVSDAIAVADALDFAVNLYERTISDTIDVTDSITPELTSPAAGTPDTILAGNQLAWYRWDLGVTASVPPAVDSQDDQFTAWNLDLAAPFSREPDQFMAGGLNGQGYIFFDKSNQERLQLAGTGIMPANCQPHVFMVVRLHAVPTVADQFFSIGQSNLFAPNDQFMYLRADPTVWQLACRTGDGFFFLSPAATHDTNWHLVEVWYDGAFLNMRIDGGSIISVAATGTLNVGNQTAICLASATPTGGSTTGDIDIAEFISSEQVVSGGVRSSLLSYLNGLYAQGWT